MIYMYLKYTIKKYLRQNIIVLLMYKQFTFYQFRGMFELINFPCIKPCQLRTFTSLV